MLDKCLQRPGWKQETRGREKNTGKFRLTGTGL